MARPRKQTYTTNMYLGKMKSSDPAENDIRNDADVQRGFVWKAEQINELCYTVFTDDYMPPIILAEMKNGQLYIVDGGQRSASLRKFRFGFHKITKSIDNPIVIYKTKKRDENGKIVVDDHGEAIIEDVEFNLIGKTFNDLPDELKTKFDEYQIETVIHEDCDMKRVSELIKRYNSHTSMNASQKAFTHISNYAREVRSILEDDFFLNGGTYTEAEKGNGTVERVVLESVMCSKYVDEWKKDAKQLAKHLNNNAKFEDFEEVRGHFERIGSVITPEVSEIFDSKNTFLWMGLYRRFLKYGVDDTKYIEFLSELAKSEELHIKEVDGITYKSLCVSEKTGRTRTTKDKYIIVQKLDVLEKLMIDFLDIETDNFLVESVLDFVKENVNPEVTSEDISDYEEDFEIITLDVDSNSRLLNEENKPSLIAMVAYGYKNDIIIDDWMIHYMNSNTMYLNNQKKNFLHMVDDLENYLVEKVVA